MGKATSTLRQKEIIQIHALARELGMDTADKSETSEYRCTLHSLTRQYSTSDMDHIQRRRVIDHFIALRRKYNEWGFIDTAVQEKRPLLRKICVVCRKLKAGKSYAEGVAKRQHGIDRRLEMMTHGELWLVAGALQRTLDFKEREAHEQT